MTKKHFEMLAKNIRDAKQQVLDAPYISADAMRFQLAGIGHVEQAITESLAYNYPKFDVERFIEACEVN